jgi:hypothetical protein
MALSSPLRFSNCTDERFPADDRNDGIDDELVDEVEVEVEVELDNVDEPLDDEGTEARGCKPLERGALPALYGNCVERRDPEDADARADVVKAVDSLEVVALLLVEGSKVPSDDDDDDDDDDEVTADVDDGLGVVPVVAATGSVAVEAEGV